MLEYSHASPAFTLIRHSKSAKFTARSSCFPSTSAAAVPQRALTGKQLKGKFSFGAKHGLWMYGTSDMMDQGVPQYQILHSTGCQVLRFPLSCRKYAWWSNCSNQLPPGQCGGRHRHCTVLWLIVRYANEGTF